MLNKNISKFINLIDWFSKNSDKAIIALSGGVDSAVVALAAKKALGDSALAITANYQTLAQDELSSAIRVAHEIDIRHKIIEYSELDNSEFSKNNELRCYYCRLDLGKRLLEEARKNGIGLIVDGSHTDDLQEDRPGMRALRESGVRSPLLELGLNKMQIRTIALKFSLSVYDKPSNSCLASRIPRGIEVTYERLRKIEISESIVKNTLNVRQVRVRDHGDIARIEVHREEFHKLFDIHKLDTVNNKLKKLGFRFVTIDISGYRVRKLMMLEE